MLEVERQFFDEHQAELKAKHPNRYVVIVGDRVIGAYETSEQALAAGSHAVGLDPFLLRHVDYESSDLHLPALTLGLLRADSEFSG